VLKTLFSAVAGLFSVWWVVVIFSEESDWLRWSGIPLVAAFVGLAATLLIFGRRFEHSAPDHQTVADGGDSGPRREAPGPMLQLSCLLIALSWAWFSFLADGAPAWQLFLAVLLSIVIPMLVHVGRVAARKIQPVKPGGPR
jgi:hypothetical protein